LGLAGRARTLVGSSTPDATELVVAMISQRCRGAP
jgi:hypothetical protein